MDGGNANNFIFDIYFQIDAYLHVCAIFLRYHFSILYMRTLRGIKIVTEEGFNISFSFFSSNSPTLTTVKTHHCTKERKNSHIHFALNHEQSIANQPLCIVMYLTFQSEEMLLFAVQRCYDNWWTNLLYINNFIPNNVREMVCANSFEKKTIPRSNFHRKILPEYGASVNWSSEYPSNLMQ